MSSFPIIDGAEHAWTLRDPRFEIDPEVVAPTHCTGWRAIHALADAFPEAFVPGSVGTRYDLQGTGE